MPSSPTPGPRSSPSETPGLPKPPGVCYCHAKASQGNEMSKKNADREKEEEKDLDEEDDEDLDEED